MRAGHHVAQPGGAEPSAAMRRGPRHAWLGDLPWRVLGLGRAGAGRAEGVASVWLAWERLMLGLHRLVAARQGGIFRYRVQTYRGPNRVLHDGGVVRRGDPVVELHFDNRALVALREKPGYGAWKVVRELRLDLAALQEKVGEGRLGAVVALHGTSLMGPAGGLLGFESSELPHTWRNGFVQYFLAGLDAIYHPAGLKRLRGAPRRRWPAEVWMSADALRHARLVAAS